MRLIVHGTVNVEFVSLIICVGQFYILLSFNGIDRISQSHISIIECTVQLDFQIVGSG